MVNQNIQPIVIWLLILTSVILIGVITYVYTNRNARTTWAFTLGSIILIGLIKIVREVDDAIHSQFIGRFNETSTPYIAIQPGWEQLFHAWHLWVLPVIIITFILCFLFYLLFRYQATHVRTTTTTIIRDTTTPSISKSSQKLGHFLAVDSAKRESTEANEKLAETLLMSAAQEIQLSDLRMDVRALQRELEKTQRTSQERIETLELEFAAKTKENNRLSAQLKERTQELEQLLQSK